MKRILITACCAAVLSACGGSSGGGDGGNGGNGGGQANPPDNPNSGRFVDNPVSGLAYSSAGGSGLTGADGGYTGAGTMRFFIGDIALGSAPFAAFLTPVDLVPGAADEQNATVTNLIRLLQTLDEDRRAANGIQITQRAREAGAGRSLNFNQTVAAFEQDPNVRAFLNAAIGASQQGPGNVQLVSTALAQAHMRKTLDHIAQNGAPNRLPVASAGPNQLVNSGDTVILDGGASRDADPRDPAAPIRSYAWRQLAGPRAQVTPGDTPAQRRFVPQTAGDVTLLFELTVTDDDGAEHSDRMNVAVRGRNGDGGGDNGGGDNGGGDNGGGDNGGGDNGGGDNGGGDNGGGDNGGGDNGGGDPDPVNSAPVADNASFSVLEAQPLSGNLTATDDDGDDLEFFVVDGPQSGSLEFPGDGSFTYRPDPGFSGADSFTFLANDGGDDSNVATAAITVNPIPVGRILGGAAKRSVTPLQEHIDGVTEERFAGAPHQQQFNLGGFGIDPLQNFPDPIGGFGAELTEPAGDRRYREDDTWVRTLILSRRNEDGSDTRVAFITLDAVGAGNIIQAGLKAAVNQATGIPEANILFGQTHSHAGADLQGLWGGVPQSWIDNLADGNGLYQLAAASAREAMDELRVAKLSVSARELPQFNNYRRPQVNPDADADATATLLRVRAADDDAVIANLLQYNAHPTSIGTNDHEGVDNLQGRVPHPDYITGVTRNLEADGGVALFYNGPIADASPSSGGAPAGENAYETVRNRGQALASAARAGESGARLLSNDLSVRHVEALLPVTNPLFIAVGGLGAFNRYYDFTQIPFADIPGIGPIAASQASNLPQATPSARTLVSRITLGSGDGALEIVTIPGEATNSFGEYIQALAGKQTMLLGLTQNSFGYILPEEEFSYLSETGDTGLIVPFTNYEEFVSLGPLTAPLLRIQAYNPLFDAPPEANVPPSLAACFGVENGDRCILQDLAERPDFIQRAYGQTCRDNGLPEEFCSLIDPGALAVLAEQCRANGGPEALCSALENVQLPDGGAGALNPGLIATAADATLRGCDILDPAHCMMPFPSDHFTTAAAPGSIQSAEKGGTGKRININILGMPRNVAGKPVNPTEWNRNDGFSPGQLITTVVPGLDFDPETGAVPDAPPITNIQESLFNENASVMVIDADTGTRHLIWAEMDLNAGFLLPSEGVADPTPEPPALMIRPARNFVEGHRYIVVLRNMQDAAGGMIPANPAFAVCRDQVANPLPQVNARCAELEENVFAPLAELSGMPGNNIAVARDDSLFLAWDFTVSSEKSLTARLLHMRDDAFASLDGGAPPFTVDEVIESPSSLVSRRIQGTLTVPSYLILPDSTPLDTAPLLGVLDQFQGQFPGEFDDVFGAIELVGNAALPPNRLFYNPADGPNGIYGDGLPDRTGDLTVDYICNVPRAAVEGSELNPARASLYGHGLLGSGTEVNNGSHVATMGNAHNIMFCAIDWYGFASPDVPNVLTALVDLSLFPLVPDGSQQGMVNFMFLARLLKHDEGFAAHPAFQADGQPVFDRREVFYDGNSQGGILGGTLIAVSPDVHRGVLGVPGMNYSTLLRRSVDFDVFSIPLYLSYQSTLDRTFLFSFMEMTWERSENNGYAAHLNKDPLPGLDGEPLPTKRVLLHPAYADHQVTMWSADVMARTMFAAADGSRTTRHPDEVPFDFLDPISYTTDADRGGASSFDGSALVIWDQLWTGAVDDRCVGQTTPVPPVGNVPPRVGDDPHECPRREVSAQCQKSHFMHIEGAVVDVSGVSMRSDCPVLPDVGPAPGAPDGGGNDDGGDNPFAACQSDPASPDCPLSPLAEFLDPAAVPALLDSLAQCPTDADGPQCVVSALQNAAPGGLGDCQPKLSNPACPTGQVVAGVLGALDNPVAPGSGPGAATAAPDGESYAVYLASASGQTIAFQVLEPNLGSSAFNGKYPLVLHGHGYGGSRSTEGFDTLRNAGYGVISIDLRGFGESSGTVRVMDPDFEGRDLIRILDWAENNLPWLAYAPAAPNAPDTGLGKGNPLVGSIGGSYGGGYQLLLLNIDPERRLDALVPDITWNDLRFSLNPGDVIKTGWSLGLVGIGEVGSGGQQDPFIKETLVRGAATGIFPSDSLAFFNYHSPDYYCGAPARRDSIYPALPDFPGAGVPRQQPPAADILFTQGFRDTLFNFNDAFYNYQCYKARGGDVRLYTHQTGHILPFPNVGTSNPFAVGGAKSCGSVALDSNAELAWFNEHIKGVPNAADTVLNPNNDVCLSLADGDAVFSQDVPYGGMEFELAGVAGAPVIARTGLAGSVPTIVELGDIDAGGDVLGGVPRASLTVSLPGGVVPPNANVADDVLRLFDSILFLGIGRRPAGGTSFELIDDQVMPVRGLGDFEIDLVGVAERLNAGDSLGLMIWGFHGQYPGSFSRDATVSLVQIDGSVALPLRNENVATPAPGGGAGDNPLVALIQPLLGNDPVGVSQLLGSVAGNVTDCISSADPLGCQQSVIDTVEAAAIAAGLPLSQAPNRCDLPAGDPDPVNEPLQWQARDLVNILCSTQRLTDMAVNPAFSLRFAQKTPRTFSDNIFDQLDNPTRPAITLAQALPGGTTADPFRVIEDWEAAGRGRFQEISFIASSGAKLNGRILTPNPEIPPPYPVVVITTGSIQGYQEMYNWAAEGLAEAGYMVLTYDVQGQGESETFPHAPDGSIACGLDGCEGVPFQQDSNFFQGARNSLDFLLSRPSSPYANAVPAASPSNPNAAGTNRFNPLWAQVDRRRIGLAGHSLGASAVSVVGQERGCARNLALAQRDGCVSAIVGWDAVSTVSADVPLKVPALSLTAEYFFNPTPANPMDPPNPDVNLGFFNQLTSAGIDAMHVGLRSSTHLEWTYVPYILPASRYGERVSMHYTLAWFDRYLRGDPSATARLTTRSLGASADASSIGAGTYDVINNVNVPYRIAGDCVANRLSIYQRSAYSLNGGAIRANDLRARGCPSGL